MSAWPDDNMFFSYEIISATELDPEAISKIGKLVSELNGRSISSVIGWGKKRELKDLTPSTLENMVK